MKRIICLTICILILAGCFLQFGCAGARGGGIEACTKFLALITEGSYGAAYEMISDSLKNLTGEPTEGDAAMISYEEFVNKYTSIYDAIGVDAITCEITSQSESSASAIVRYTLIYETEKAGELKDETYSIEARYENNKWGVQWSPACIFTQLRWGDKLLLGVNYPKRGEIFDAQGELLVKNIDPVAIFCVPSSIKDPERFKEQVLAISELQPRGSLYQDWYGIVDNASTSKNSSVVLTRLYPDQLDEQLENRILAVEGLGIDRSGSLTSTRFRAYPFGRSASHVLGFASIIWKDDLKRFKEEGSEIYDGDSWLGYSGLEKEYEEILRGTKGSYAYIQGADGTNRMTLYNIPAVDGQDLHLTLDIRMQQRVEKVVDTIVYDKSISGTVIMLDPTTGAVQAMYSFPDYDAESFSRGTVGSVAWAQMEKDPQTPMLNRAVQGLYAPGSTFKTLTGLGALETGTLTTESVFPETEKIKIAAGKSQSGNWKDSWIVSQGEWAFTGIDKVNRTFSSNRHTPMNMESSIIDSDNIFFSWAALKMGWEKFKSYMTYIGIGEKVPFELTTDSASQIKDEDSTETWDLLAMSGYGQGEILITPLQMATYIGAIHNGGVAMVPYIVDSTWQASGTAYIQTQKHEPQVWRSICSKVNADTMEEMMKGVCALPEDHGGTAKYLGIRRVFTIAGKTGTAEIGTGDVKDKELAWFIGFRSCYNAAAGGGDIKPEEERLVLVMLEINLADPPEEYTLMKFKIARELLKDDELTKPSVTESAIVDG
ncbi:MAG: hypothetical protein IJP98_03100 [Clostridia bacterium]|nr:hypothetical protein [Clostridia bacterium]